jgi:hypothetical protein
MKKDEGVDIHQAPLPHHHHTAPFVSVGDNPGQFFFHPAHGGALRLEAGDYAGELVVKGRNVTAATARIRFTFAHPRCLALSLDSDS